ncbi:MAG: PKD domain-containing protein, partial [Candidatus Thermoplasmatota archaeon]
PKTKISVSPDVKDKWYTKLPKITLSSEENAKIYYQWDEGKENVYTSPIIPMEGNHTLYYYSIDEAGNKEEKISRIFLIDINAPKAKLALNKNSIYVSDTLIIDAKSSKDNIGIKSYFFDFGDNSNSGWIKDNIVEHKYLKEGRFTIQLKVRDYADNEDTFIETVNVMKKEEGILAPDIGVGGQTIKNYFYVIPIFVFLIILSIGVFYLRRRRREIAYSLPQQYASYYQEEYPLESYEEVEELPLRASYYQEQYPFESYEEAKPSLRTGEEFFDEQIIEIEAKPLTSELKEIIDKLGIKEIQKK